MSAAPDNPLVRDPATLPVAVIGCGYWGRNLVRNFADLHSLAAVCDLDPGASEGMGAQYRVPVLTAEDVMAAPDIAAVVIATPAVTHYDLARQALEAGKHVLVEKPLALAVEQARALVDLARERGLVLMVGHLLRYHPAFEALQELVATGRLGTLQYIYSNRLNLGKIRREENILWSFAPHDISAILALTGTAPESVMATGASFLDHAVADVTNTWLSFPGGIRAHVFVSWLHPFKEQRLVVTGSAGMAVFDDTRDWPEKLVVYGHRIEWHDNLPRPDRRHAEPVAVTAAEPLRRECQHFLDCIHDGRRPRTDGAEGTRTLQVLAAAEQAMAAGCGVTLAEAPPAPAAPPRIHETAVVDAGARIGAGTRIWHFSHVYGRARIGADCVLGQNVMVADDVTVGDGCKIQNNVSLYSGVHLEDGVFVGPSAVFTNVRTPRAEISRRDAYAPTHVGRGATIGANATIVCGVRLGPYCLVGAGAVVTRDVAPHALVTGNPARRTGWVSHAGEVLGADLVCPRTGRTYRVTGEDRLDIADGV